MLHKSTGTGCRSQAIYGSIGLAMEGLGALRARLGAAQRVLGGTLFAWEHHGAPRTATDRPSRAQHHGASSRRARPERCRCPPCSAGALSLRAGHRSGGHGARVRCGALPVGERLPLLGARRAAEPRVGGGGAAGDGGVSRRARPDHAGAADPLSLSRSLSHVFSLVVFRPSLLFLSSTVSRCASRPRPRPAPRSHSLQTRPSNRWWWVVPASYFFTAAARRFGHSAAAAAPSDGGGGGRWRSSSDCAAALARRIPAVAHRGPKLPGPPRSQPSRPEAVPGGGGGGDDDDDDEFEHARPGACRARQRSAVRGPSGSGWSCTPSQWSLLQGTPLCSSRCAAAPGATSSAAGRAPHRLPSAAAAAWLWGLWGRV
eukprot:SAG11_NODE_3063_length_2717_cov_1.987777_2_plen_372_part_00